MRTNIDLDDTLLREAMKITGLSSKKATVEEALRRLVKFARQAQAFNKMRGMGWEGDLEEMRKDRTFDDAE